MWSCFCKTRQSSQATIEWQLPLFLLIFWLTFIIISKQHKLLYCGVFVWSTLHSSLERLEECFYPLWQIQINDTWNKKCSMFSKNGIMWPNTHMHLVLKTPTTQLWMNHNWGTKVPPSCNLSYKPSYSPPTALT